MLAVGYNLDVGSGVNTPLQTINQVVHILREVIRILAGSFLPPTPARVFERIDIRSKKVNARSGKIVESSGFRADNGGYLFDKGIVEGGPQKNRLRKGGSRAKIATRRKSDPRARCDAVLLSFISEIHSFDVKK